MPANKPDDTLLILAKKWLAGKITDKERSKFDQWYNSFDDSRHELFSDETDQAMEDRIKQAIFSRAKIGKPKSTRLWPRVVIAAAVVGAIAIGIYFFSGPAHLNDRRDRLTYANDIAPGRNSAILTLPNGKTISLSDTKTGVVIGAGQIKYSDGTALMSSSDDHTGAQMVTASTPRGGTYQITLPDGSKVWLNAASRISFPSQFSRATRKVILEGEAYFEVTKKRSPFIVSSRQQEVAVLGTHFNISAYTGEYPIKTTLLEGKVRVTRIADTGAAAQQTSPVILKPGEQSQFSNDRITVSKVNADAAVDWKNELFIFDNDQLEDIMKKVARWYNVEIVYQDQQVKRELFSGRISRSQNVSEVLNKLSQTGAVRFKIEGRRIFITK